MRRYRARLLAKGIRQVSVAKVDPLLGAARFSRASLLSPAERDVIRRIAIRLRGLPELPEMLAIFGSRSKGGSVAGSDIDLAVFVRNPSVALQNRILAIAHRAQAPYEGEGCAIVVRPVLLKAGQSGAFLESIKDDLEVVWTKPR